MPTSLLETLPAVLRPLLIRPVDSASIARGSSVKLSEIRAAAQHAADESGCSTEQRTTLLAGLLLLHDHLDESHELSQTLEGKGSPRTADYWHGIMHRREPDAGNAAYWFRRVGSHPALTELGANLAPWLEEVAASEDVRQESARLITRGVFDPFAMIELSTEALESLGSVADQTLRAVQYLETLNLLRWSFGGPDVAGSS